MRAIVAEPGAPGQLAVRELPDPEPGPGETLIRVRAAGINFADLGAPHVATNGPHIPGLEVAGEEVESGRPVMALMPGGGYAELAVADRRLIFDATGLETVNAGGSLLVSATAWYAIHELGRLAAGETVLVAPGAGGLGSAAVQIARRLGAGRVVAVCSSEDKRRHALSLGADQAISYEETLSELDLVVDGVGGAYSRHWLEALRPLGRIVLLGSASGSPPSIPGFAELRSRNLAVIGFSFGVFRRARPDLVRTVLAPLLELLKSGDITIPVCRTFRLDEAAMAQRVLAARQSIGKLVLLP